MDQQTRLLTFLQRYNRYRADITDKSEDNLCAPEFIPGKIKMRGGPLDPNGTLAKQIEIINQIGTSNINVLNPTNSIFTRVQRTTENDALHLICRGQNLSGVNAEFLLTNPAVLKDIETALSHNCEGLPSRIVFAFAECSFENASLPFIAPSSGQKTTAMIFHGCTFKNTQFFDIRTACQLDGEVEHYFDTSVVEGSTWYQSAKCKGLFTRTNWRGGAMIGLPPF